MQAPDSAQRHTNTQKGKHEKQGRKTTLLTKMPFSKLRGSFQSTLPHKAVKLALLSKPDQTVCVLFHLSEENCLITQKHTGIRMI